MSFERTASNASFIEVLDHVLDKGIVIDAWVRVSLIGLDLLTFDARVVVASIESYVNHAGSLSEVGALTVNLPRALKRASPLPS